MNTASAQSLKPSWNQSWELQVQHLTKMRAGPDYFDMAGQGYRLYVALPPSLLDASDSVLVPIDIDLPAGEYQFMLTCDYDCSDIDFDLVRNNTIVSHSNSSEDWPLHEYHVLPGQVAHLKAKVTMYGCSTPNCGYQISIWRRELRPAAP